MDTRRLLSDYLYRSNDSELFVYYRSTQFNNIYQAINLIGLLTWILYFSIFLGLFCCSFVYASQSFIQVLLVTEGIVVGVFLLCLAVASLVNSGYLLMLGLILIIVGCLELALCFLLLA